jgi:hypothetical protein
MQSYSNFDDTAYQTRSKLSKTRSFNLQETFPCPICRKGQVQSMVMMETLSCSFCRHIFSADLPKQILRVEDTIPKSVWTWQGDRWTSLHLADVDLTLLVWFTSIFIMVVPATVLGLSAYMFPPIGGLQWNSFSVVWSVLTFGSHSTISAWLLVEHYQLPGYVAAKITIQRMLEQLKTQFSTQ